MGNKKQERILALSVRLKKLARRSFSANDFLVEIADILEDQGYDRPYWPCESALDENPAYSAAHMIGDLLDRINHLEQFVVQAAEHGITEA